MEFTPVTFKTRCPRCNGKIKYSDKDTRLDLSGLELGPHSNEEMEEYEKKGPYYIICPGCEQKIDVTDRKQKRIMSKLGGVSKSELIDFLLGMLNETLNEKKDSDEND